MNRRHVILQNARSALNIMLLAACVGANTPALAGQAGLSWRTPVYADLGSGSDAPFKAYWGYGSLPNELLHMSTSSVDGMILSGGAQRGPSSGPDTVYVPYLAKVAALDGTLLWSWRAPSSESGRFWASILDGAGNVVAVGGTPADGLSRLLLVKVDGGTGAPVWRVDEALPSFGLAVEVDSHDDIFVTYAADDQQRVAKYSGVNGTLQWSRTLAESNDIADDFRIAVDAAGNAIAGGFFESISGNNIVYGVQVSKFDGVSGTVVWTKRFPGQDIFSSATLIRSLPSGDVLLGTKTDGLMRLDVDTGEVQWTSYESSEEVKSAWIDAAGNIYTSGRQWQSDGLIDATVRRLNPNTGTSEWERIFSFARETVAFNVTGSHDGALLVSLNTPGYAPHMGAASVDMATGALNWQLQCGNVDADGGTTPVGIVQATDGSVFVGANDDSFGSSTWAIYKLTGPFSDDIFANGYDNGYD